MENNVEIDGKAEGELADAELMARVKAGDDLAFEKLVDRHKAKLLNFFYRLTWDRVVSEDLAQEVFIKLYTHSDTYEPVARFTTYLYRIGRNCWIDHLRRTKQERKLKSLEAEDGEGGSLREVIEARGSEAPSDGARKVEFSDAIVAAIDSLSEDQKLVFVMGEVQGMRYLEIAKALDIPIGTVKSRMYHAVRHLRGRLKGLRRAKAPKLEPGT